MKFVQSNSPLCSLIERSVVDILPTPPTRAKFSLQLHMGEVNGAAQLKFRTESSPWHLFSTSHFLSTVQM